MKIKDIKLFTIKAGWKPWSFLKIETNSNLVGWSETTDTFGNENGFKGILKDYKNILIGEDPIQINKLIWKLETTTKSNSGSLVQRVIAGIENALWDINGKFCNRPVYELFGGKVRDKIELYWSHCGTTRVRNSKEAKKPKINNLADIKKFGKEVKKSGFKTIKTNIALFDKDSSIYMPGHKYQLNNPSLKMSSEVLSGIEFWISSLQKNIGKNISIALDLNFNFKLVDLKKICKRLEKYNLKWIEIDNIDSKVLTHLRKETSIPLVSCETLDKVISYKPYLENKSLDYASIDTIWIGFGASKKISDLCNLYDTNITTHNYNGYLGTLINGHLGSIIENFFIGELDFDEPPGIKSIFSDNLNIHDGFLKLNNKPGWGCDIIEKNLKNY